MKMQKRSVPLGEPWGVPSRMAQISESVCCTLVCVGLCEYSLARHLRMLSLIPLDRRWCQTAGFHILSKAPSKSKKAKKRGVVLLSTSILRIKVNISVP